MDSCRWPGFLHIRTDQGNYKDSANLSSASLQGRPFWALNFREAVAITAASHCKGLALLVTNGAIGCLPSPFHWPIIHCRRTVHIVI